MSIIHDDFARGLTSDGDAATWYTLSGCFDCKSYRSEFIFVSTPQQFHNFRDFYPYYLEQHSDINCRRFHFLGTTLAVAAVAYAIVTQTWLALLLAPILGYGCAWIGHFGFEKNKPAAFDRFGYSFIGDWLMYKDMLTGKVKLW